MGFLKQDMILKKPRSPKKKEVMKLIKLITFIIYCLHLHFTIQNLHLRNTFGHLHINNTHIDSHISNSHVSQVSQTCKIESQTNASWTCTTYTWISSLLWSKALSHYIMYACQQTLLIYIINLYNTFFALHVLV